MHLSTCSTCQYPKRPSLARDSFYERFLLHCHHLQFVSPELSLVHLHNQTQHLYIHIYNPEKGGARGNTEIIQGLDNIILDELLGMQADELREEIELVKGASHTFDKEAYLKGELSPIFFGSAINNFGIQELLDSFVEHAPSPLARDAGSRLVDPTEEAFTGFVFKIQANMDPAHRDRIAFLRICSGSFVPARQSQKHDPHPDPKRHRVFRRRNRWVRRHHPSRRIRPWRLFEARRSCAFFPCHEAGRGSRGKNARDRRWHCARDTGRLRSNDQGQW